MAKAAGFIIFRKLEAGFEYLLLQASYGSHHWTPPKGHVDPGENEMQTAIRETEEEAGLKQEDLRIISNFRKVLQFSLDDIIKKKLKKPGSFRGRNNAVTSKKPLRNISDSVNRVTKNQNASSSVSKFLRAMQYEVNGKQKTVVYWPAELQRNVPVVLSSEHEDYKWLNLSEACKISNYSNFQNLLKECEEFLSKNY